MGRRIQPKGLIKRLKAFPKHTTVKQTPKRVLYFTEGIEYFGVEADAWMTIIYIKPILEFLAKDHNGKLKVTLEKVETGGTSIIYKNEEGVRIGDDFYYRQSFRLEEFTLLYIGGTLMLPNEFNEDWDYMKE